MTIEDAKSKVGILIPHATYGLPSKVREGVRELVEDSLESVSPVVVMQNYSDWVTRFVADLIDPNYKVVGTRSRLMGDLARRYDASDFVRNKDFGGISVVSKKLKDELVENKELKEYYNQYFKRVDELEESLLENANGGRIMIVDLHDTGEWMLQDTGKWEMRVSSEEKEYEGFPPFILSTVDGESCDKDVLNILNEEIENKFGSYLDNLKSSERLTGATRLWLQDFSENGPLINEYYHGGFGVKRLAERKKKNKNINGVQIELARWLYMNEKTQIRDSKKLKEIQKMFKEVVDSVNSRI